MIRGIKFLDLVSFEDLEAIEDALVAAKDLEKLVKSKPRGSKADQALDRSALLSTIRTGDEILERVISDGKKRQPRDSKTGPKPKSSLNQTDEDLRLLLIQIRKLLGLEPSADKPIIFSTLISALHAGQKLVRGNVFFTRDELWQMDSLSRYEAQCEFVRNLVESIRRTDWSADGGDVERHSFDELLSKSATRGAKNATWDEKKAYTSVALALDMVLLPDFANKLREEAKGLSTHSSISDQDYPSEFGHLALSRVQMLTLAEERLRHFKLLSLDVPYAICGDVLEDTHKVLSALSVEAFPPNDEFALSKISRLLFDAMSRQGVNPFSHKDNADWVARPAVPKEGIPSTGGLLDYRRGLSKSGNAAPRGRPIGGARSRKRKTSGT